ncbi:hypothetical protein [Dongia sp.]
MSRPLAREKNPANIELIEKMEKAAYRLDNQDAFKKEWDRISKDA